MGTLSSEVFDLFLMNIEDYRLDIIFSSSGSLVLDQYLEPFLLNSINEFNGICTQSLTYVTSGSASEGYFAETLTLEHQLILSNIMVKYWLAKYINSVLQMGNQIQDRDFKTYSQAQNLKAKQDYYNSKREEISQLINDYSYKYNNFDDWRNQNFNHDTN
jgi:hypothetical protein